MEKSVDSGESEAKRQRVEDSADSQNPLISTQMVFGIDSQPPVPQSSASTDRSNSTDRSDSTEMDASGPSIATESTQMGTSRPPVLTDSTQMNTSGPSVASDDKLLKCLKWPEFSAELTDRLRQRCGECEEWSKNVNSVDLVNDNWIQCSSECSQMFHIRCVGVEERVYDILMKTNKIKWICLKCLQSQQPIPMFTIV